MSDDRFASMVAELDPLAARFSANGHMIYLVGGSVRDLLDGPDDPSSPDVDLTTDAPPETIEALVADLAQAVWTHGREFGTIGCRWSGRDIEITTHRREEYDPASRKPVVRYRGDGGSGPLSLYDDLERRDFTVNAMAVPLTGPLRGELVDPHGGEADWRDRVLRTPLRPEVAFTDDPLRMVRAARFVATKALQPVDELTAAAHRNRARIEIVAVERVRAELDRLLMGQEPDRGLEFLFRTGLLTRICPGFDPAVDPAVVFATVARVEADLAVRAAALLAWEQRESGSDWPADDPGAAAAARDRMRALRFAGAEVDAVGTIVRFAGWPALLATCSPEEARRFAAATGPMRHATLQLATARAAATDDDVQRHAVEALRAALSELGRSEDLDHIGPGLDGVRVMEILGVGPGPEVGRALDYLTGVRITDGPLPAAELEERLRRWAGSPDALS